jgi:transcriptional regulator with XRE-family HTH domain
MTATTTADRTPSTPLSWLPDYLPDGSVVAAPSLPCAWKAEKFHTVIARDAARSWATVTPGAGPAPGITARGAFADRLLRLRYDAALTQDQLAARLGLSPSFVSRLESGERAPSTDCIARLCAAFGIAAREADQLYLEVGLLPPDIDGGALLALLEMVRADDAARAA